MLAIALICCGAIGWKSALAASFRRMCYDQADSQPYYEVLQQIAQQWGIVGDNIALLRNGLNHVFAGMLGSGTAVDYTHHR
jgi:hypothetical protein